MASTGRRSSRHLVDELLAEGPRFRFFQAVRLLALSTGDTGNKAAIPDSLRFGSPLSLAFQASEISSVESRQDKLAQQAAERNGNENLAIEVPNSSREGLNMTVGFMGMTGPSGVLPVAYTELLVDRRNQFRDNTGHQFLDLFTHRAVSLFYQAWRKHRFYLSYEAGNTDGFSRNLLDLVGVGLRNLQQRLLATGGGIPDRFLIHYAGLLSQKPISAANIGALVRGYFAVDAHIEEFVGQWMQLPVHEQSSLASGHCCLGLNAFVGERLWDRQTKIRIRIGPVDAAQFAQFMPGMPGLAALRELIRFCVGFTLDCDVALILKRDAIPAPVMDASSSMATRLGYNVWMNSLPPTKDSDDVCFPLLNGGSESVFA